MAKLSKKWGTVIACWGVALVLIIMGICLGLTIPSDAADENEGDIAVMFDGEETIYHTMQEAFTAVNALNITADNVATIQLRSNVKTLDVQVAMYKDYTLDLNGYVWSVANIMQVISYDDVVKIVDSRPQAAHYFAYVGNGKYEYANVDYKPGFDTLIEGGVIMATNADWPAMFVSEAENGASQLVLDAGTYLGNLVLGMQGFATNTVEVVLNQGVNVLSSVDSSIYGLSDSTNYDVALLCQGTNGKLTIKGGNIYGEIVNGEFNDENQLVGIEKIDITDKTNLPAWIDIDSTIKMVEKEIDGVKVYAAVPADATTEDPEPITKPTEPIVDAKEQPANNNNNLIGLIVLGAAAVVMVVGVTTIIIVNVKRRKKVA